MKKNGLVILLVVLCTSFSTLVFAETIVLKSGSTLEGKIIEKTDKYIKIDFQGVVLTYASDEIERIDGENKISLAPSDKIERIDEENKIDSTPPEINKARYAPVQQGLKGFRCEVASSSFDQIKDTYNSKSPATDSENIVLNSIKFYLTYDQYKPEDKFSFDSTPFNLTGNAEFDSIVQQAINNVRDLTLDPREANGFCFVWSQIINYSFWNAQSKYTKEKLPDGYCISYRNEEGDSVKVFSDNNFIISEIIVTDEKGGVTRRKFNFMGLDKSLLLQRYEEDSDNGSREYVVTIDYQEVEGFQMPKLVLIQDTKLGSTQSFKLNFSNFEIKK